MPLSLINKGRFVERRTSFNDVLTMQIIGKCFPLESFFGAITNYILLKVEELYAYENGIKTNNMIGYSYHVVGDSTYEKIVVKVPDILSEIKQEDIHKDGTKTFVTFKNAVGKIYKKPDGRVDVTFTADAVSIKK